MLRTHPLVATAFLLLGALSVPACSNSSGTTTTGGSASDYCGAFSSYVTRCNVTDACELAELKECTTLAGLYSGAALAAASTCLNAVPCSDAGLTSASSCFQATVSAATPTATQTRLAQDYCTSCAAIDQTLPECVSTFYTASLGDSGIALGAGPGNGLQELSDSVAASVDDKCIPALADAGGGLVACDVTFRVCEGQVYAAAFPKQPPACTGGVSLGDGG